MLSPTFLDEVRARTTLSGLVSRGVKLVKAGREHKGCCPFHHEKSPSFTVNDEKGFAHCFGCGWHGDAIRWVVEHDGLDFIDAVRQLADAAGLAMPARSPEAAAAAARIDAVRPALDAANSAFLAALAADSGADAAAWLTARGVGRTAAAEFALGWAKGGGTLKGLGIGEKVATSAGLIAAGMDGDGLFERFRARVTIPIHDARGRLCGFGGALIAPSSGSFFAPKYLNSPDGILFDKGRLLFNLHRAAPRVRPKADGRGLLDLLIVEGYFDAIACHGAGWPAVAPLGTALTEAQLERAWRVHPSPVLLFDGDGAGRAAMMRAIGRALPLIGPGRSLRIGELPSGQDPDDVIRAGGARALDAIVAAAKDVFEHVADVLIGSLVDAGDGGADKSGRDDRREFDLPLPVRAAACWDELDRLASSIAHADTRALYWAGWRRRWEAVAGLRAQMVAADSDDASAKDAGLIVDDVVEVGGDMRLLAVVLRIERLIEARMAVNEDIKDALAVAKAVGFDPGCIRRRVAERAMDPEKREQREAIDLLYRRALGIDGPLSEAMMPPPFAMAHGRAVDDKRLAPRAKALAWHDIDGDAA